LNDAWADLGELIDTRSQMLQASQELHKYFHDCKDVLSRILEKQNSMSDELGRDGASVSALQRKHQNFLQDLHSLQSQVEAIREDSGKLQAAYAGEKAMEITNREREVLRAWMELQAMGDSRKSKLNDTGNLFRFFAMVRSLIMWMEDLMRQMSTSEKPRDVSGVELLMNNHQGHKAEIDAREDNFGDLYSLGKELLSMSHYASNEIKEKLRELTDKRNGMIHRWEERWEHLQLILEVYQFARDAAVAEAWLIAQDPYLKSDEFGQSIDEVENLIKKHEAFEKAAAAQEERFAALERLTTFELKDMKRRQEEEQRAHADTIERQKAERYSRDQPDTRSDTSSIRETKSGDGELEGMLVRKHEWESTTKKASNRSWEKICVVLKESQIFFYKDQKTYRTHPGDTFKGEPSVDLINCTAEVATDYTKKKYVFRLRLANGGFYLFQAADEEQMELWVNGINSQAQPQDVEGSKSQTLPPGSEKKDEPKRRSFFTLKKK
jgi:spectrin beta